MMTLQQRAAIGLLKSGFQSRSLLAATVTSSLSTLSQLKAPKYSSSSCSAPSSSSRCFSSISSNTLQNENVGNDEEDDDDKSSDAANKQGTLAQAPRVAIIDEFGRAYGTGRRKTSVARVWIKEGSGLFVVNDKNLLEYFQPIQRYLFVYF